MEIPPTLESYGVENVQLSPEREHQRINAALIIALCISWACCSPPSDCTHQLQTVTFQAPSDMYCRGLVCWYMADRLSIFSAFAGLNCAKKGGSLEGKSNAHIALRQALMWMTGSGIPGILIRRATCPITTNKDFPCRSSIAAVSHEERHAAHVELLSELKNSTGSGGQQEGCTVGS
ncbi:unnamed protein product [Sphagnum balticum]